MRMLEAVKIDAVVVVVDAVVVVVVVMTKLCGLTT